MGTWGTCIADMDEDCIVCLEALSSSQTCALPCGHRLHQACAIAWKEAQPKEASCPTCRASMGNPHMWTSLRFPANQSQMAVPVQPVDQPSTARPVTPSVLRRPSTRTAAADRGYQAAIAAAEATEAEVPPRESVRALSAARERGYHRAIASADSNTHPRSVTSARPGTASGERRLGTREHSMPQQRPASASSVRRSSQQQSPQQRPASASRVRRSSLIPSRFVTPSEGTGKVKRALRRLCKALSLDKDLVHELEASVHQPHRHCKSLEGSATAKEGGSIVFQQAGIVVKHVLRGQTVTHPYHEDYHKVCASPPQIPIDMAVNYALKRLGRDVCCI